MIIVATLTPDMMMPSTPTRVQKNIGVKNATTFDIAAACKGFIYALSIADQFILDGSIENAEFEELPVFGLMIPKSLHDVDNKLLNPRNLWENPAEWDAQAIKLAEKFIKNFENFADTERGKSLVAAGPKL